MNVLMVGVDETSFGGMLTVVNHYKNDTDFCKKTNLKYIPTVTNAGKFKKILFFLKAFQKIRTTIAKEQIDIVHIHMAERGSVYREGLVLWYAKKHGIRAVVHMHGATIESWYGAQSDRKKRIIRKILNQGDKLIALGHNWVPFLKTLVDPGKVEVVYNAVPVPSENCYNPNANEILFLALFIQRKGIDDLLDAVQKIRRQLPAGVIVRLYGADRENNIDQKIRARHLGTIVVNGGWLPADKRMECFSHCMINVLPSYDEGLPMTILETMAYGIPNISTRIAAIPEAIVDGESGILINPGDVEGLAAALLRIVNSSTLRKKFSENAYQYARDHFDLRQHLNQVYALYQSLC